MAIHNLLSTLPAKFPSPASDIALPCFAQFLSTYNRLAYYVFTYLLSVSHY